METSMLGILTRIAEENKPNPPDLAIEKVLLRKIADSKNNFNFYKYYANVSLKNYGGGINNAKLVLYGDENQKKIEIKNTEKGFSLAKGQAYTIDRYELIFDGNYNGGQLELTVELADREDTNESNNSYKVDIFELPAKIENLEIEELQEDGSFTLAFEPANSSLNADKISIFETDALAYPEGEEKYSEILSSDRAYGYHKIKTSKEILNDAKFREVPNKSTVNYSVKFSEDPWTEQTAHYFYVKAINQENGNFALSNLIKVSSQKEIDRSDFAKLFVDFAGLNLETDGTYFYEDVSADSWYGPYVQTLYNLGLIKNSSSKYYPETKMSRGDVLRVVMDYCDTDLDIKPGAPHFEDVSEEDVFFPYVEGFYASGNGFALQEKFLAKQNASKNFLKYLINECKENS